ncbi:MAG: EpsI family protein [Nitrospirae bacterium]|nr:EpsI family protein [Nitrospirota bacterium]
MMNKNAKILIAAVLLSAAAVYSFAVPKQAEYKGSRFIPGLVMPDAFAGWKGVDLSEKFRINLQGAGYEFISEALAYRYTDKEKKDLLFMIINARDFHYPNGCFRSSGYKVKEMDDTELNASCRMINANTFFAEHRSKGEKTLIIYWISIDKKVVTNWAEQKMKQLFFSLFDKKNTGLLVRLDIPIAGDDIEQGLALARKLVNDLSGALTPEQADYIFGKN